jgi:hypothetical protein
MPQLAAANAKRDEAAEFALGDGNRRIDVRTFVPVRQTR